MYGSTSWNEVVFSEKLRIVAIYFVPDLPGDTQKVTDLDHVSQWLKGSWKEVEVEVEETLTCFELVVDKKLHEI